MRRGRAYGCCWYVCVFGGCWVRSDPHEGRSARRRLQKKRGSGGPATDGLPARSKEVMLRDALRSASSRRHSRSSAAGRAEHRPARVPRAADQARPSGWKIPIARSCRGDFMSASQCARSPHAVSSVTVAAPSAAARALQLELIRYRRDAGNPARDAFGLHYRIVAPDVTA